MIFREKWVSLFNGRSLKGWTPKFTGSELGQNFNDTFRVENGLLCVRYDKDKWPKFEGQFGHLFYKEKLSHYRLRVEYRFVGEQVPGGPGWATRNSGVMLHCQAPKTMERAQEFPVSIECQLLGGLGKGKRSTANLCTPGTNVVLNGKLYTPHCLDSASATYDGDQWVTVEVEVRGGERIEHRIDGKVVLSYTEPQLDERDKDAQKLLKTQPKLLTEGYISLQAESHPCEFRRVEILKLGKTK